MLQIFLLFIWCLLFASGYGYRYFDGFSYTAMSNQISHRSSGSRFVSSGSFKDESCDNSVSSDLKLFTKVGKKNYYLYTPKNIQNRLHGWETAKWICNNFGIDLAETTTDAEFFGLGGAYNSSRPILPVRGFWVGSALLEWRHLATKPDPSLYKWLTTGLSVKRSYWDEKNPSHTNTRGEGEYESCVHFYNEAELNDLICDIKLHVMCQKFDCPCPKIKSCVVDGYEGHIKSVTFKSYEENLLCLQVECRSSGWEPFSNYGAQSVREYEKLRCGAKSTLVGLQWFQTSEGITRVDLICLAEDKHLKYIESERLPLGKHMSELCPQRHWACSIKPAFSDDGSIQLFDLECCS